MSKIETVVGELQAEIKVLNRSIDKLEFDSQVTLRSIIFGDKYDKELERLKVSRYTLKYVVGKLQEKTLQ